MLQAEREAASAVELLSKAEAAAETLNAQARSSPSAKWNARVERHMLAA